MEKPKSIEYKSNLLFSKTAAISLNTLGMLLSSHHKATAKHSLRNIVVKPARSHTVATTGLSKRLNILVVDSLAIWSRIQLPP